MHGMKSMENGRLNTDNVKLAQDLQQVQEKYEKTKEESMLYLSELNLIKEKLLENDVFFEEYKQLKIDNVKLVQELQLLQDKYENIKEESKLNLNELNSLKEKLMDSSIYFEENEALKKEIIALDNNLENSKTSVINLEEDLKGAEKLLQDALETIISKDTECNELNDRLAEQQEMMNELKEQTNKHIRLLQQECNDYIEREKDVIDKFFTFSDICEDQMEYLSDDQNCSIFANVHYEIDIEYLKGVISNQKVCIASLEEFIENSKKPEVILQDVGVSAVEEPVITKDIGVLAVNTTQNEIDKMQITTSVLYKVLDRLDTYKERNQNPCDSKDLVEPGSEEDAFVLKILGMIDQKISSLLAEVKDFYETSICDLHKKYNSEAERQLSFSETSLAKLKFCYEKNLKIIKREHDEKVIRLLASHEEELRSVSMYQQKIHSIKEKISKGKKSKRN
ncbi:uncharacterized protein LOC142320064 [Lycorma delicatula]|uniref:uncharacterized protein LOC142320064 n=1 Tax=Lycorma delicatula TaxID=130591 RepID=UPI003F5145BC